MAKDFTWHEVSESEKNEIRKDSKKLLNEFSSKIQKIKSEESHFENNSGTREEGVPWKTEDDFKELIFQNAPFVEDDFIVAEKGAWKK
ncbi:MAG: hypothetical protein WC548_02495 [Candidatus Pacearchaeota archaeon]